MGLFSMLAAAVFLVLAVIQVEGFGNSPGTGGAAGRSDVTEPEHNKQCRKWWISCAKMCKFNVDGDPTQRKGFFDGPWKDQCKNPKGRARCSELELQCSSCTCTGGNQCKDCGTPSKCVQGGQDLTGVKCVKYADQCKARVARLEAREAACLKPKSERGSVKCMRNAVKKKKNTDGTSCAKFMLNENCCDPDEYGSPQEWFEDWSNKWGDGPGFSDVCDRDQDFSENQGPGTQTRHVHMIQTENGKRECKDVEQNRERPCDREASPPWGDYPAWDDSFEPCTPCNVLEACCKDHEGFVQQCNEKKAICAQNANVIGQNRDACWTLLGRAPQGADLSDGICADGCYEFMDECGWHCEFSDQVN